MSQPNEKKDFKQSNAYIIIYSVILTVVCGIVLASAALGLKPAQDANVEMEKKQSILSAAGIKTKTREEASKIYEKRVKGIVINFNAEEQKNLKAGDIVVADEWKKAPEKRNLPIFEIKSEDGNKTDFYVIPVYGFGLWNDIWGYIALKSDMNTINGVIFDHKGETPGLGARIKDKDVQDRYVGKKIFDAQKKLMPIFMEKGENGGGQRSIDAFKEQPHKVDGMSGATITGKGVSKMLEDYLKCYEKYFKSKLDNKIVMNSNY
jgi:Na+-transporting NADH:ubiquinone oxidoreductase subunit C